MITITSGGYRYVCGAGQWNDGGAGEYGSHEIRNLDLKEAAAGPFPAWYYQRNKMRRAH